MKISVGGITMKINQRKIAQQANVSFSTVSRIFNGSSYVKPAMREKVIKAMEELGYPLDTLSLNACKKTNKFVLIVVGDVTSSFYVSILKGICDVLVNYDMFAVLCNSGFDASIEEKYIRHANENNFVGIIMITAVERSSFVQLLKNITIPVVLVNRYIRSMDLDVVCIDNHRGGYLATNYLIKNGHKRIAHIAGPSDSTATQDRMRGFLDAMADSELYVGENDIYYGDLTRESGYRIGMSICNNINEYTAVFSCNEPMTFGLINCLIDNGFHVPKDLSIICFDDSPASAEGKVRLTTVSYDAYPLGETAANTLIKRLSDKKTERVKIIYPPHMTIRDSVKSLIQEDL